MSAYRIAFVGMGSIGRRHLRDTAAFLRERKTECCVDVYRSGTRGALSADVSNLIRNEYLLSDGSITDSSYDIVFITNPTSLHFETLRRFVHASRAFFIEKPAFSDDSVDLSWLPSDKLCYVACPLRYHPVIQYVKTELPCWKAYAARAISSSYLPDWRPGVDYRSCYSAHTELGGGVDVDLIHEWDYLTQLFGPVQSGFSIRDRVSQLEIDSCDVAVYIARTEKAMIELHLDYFGRKSIRQLQLFFPEETIDCDILNGTVTSETTGKRIVFDCDRDIYQKAEIEHFFDIVEGRRENDSTIENALRVLRYARGVF